MRHTNLVVQLVSVAIFCLYMVTTGSATRKEELERAAELAVERAAEIVAERAVEKALESGNSSTETETIRMSHSSVRKQDLSWQLPGFAYTPHQYKEYERIIDEQQAGERAVAQLKGRRILRQTFNDENNQLNPTVKPIDISTFPYRSTPIRFINDQYQYSRPEEKYPEVNEQNKENKFYGNSGRSLLQQPQEVFQLTSKTLPVFYYFSKPATYPSYVQYFSPQSQQFMKDDNRKEKF